jgi:predicted 3-demethylubiquinone-9 3-methyltransferase (glyoxalase superfamily)
MQKITTFLWFDGNVEEAMIFYTSVFKDSKAGGISRYGSSGPGPEGSVMTASFQLFGQDFVALNGGPQYSFTPAISFAVKCETQKEIDDYWEKLTEGGKEIQCGWLTDKYGLSWQIVPAALGEMMMDKDAKKSKRVMQAMLKMVKLDVKKLKEAYDGD